MRKGETRGAQQQSRARAEFGQMTAALTQQAQRSMDPAPSAEGTQKRTHMDFMVLGKAYALRWSQLKYLCNPRRYDDFSAAALLLLTGDRMTRRSSKQAVNTLQTFYHLVPKL